MANERKGAVSIVARPDPIAEARARARGVRFQFELSRDDFNVTYRKVVVLPILRDQGWTFGGNERIAFFQSTGTSNPGYEFLRGTYFPTFGVCNPRERYPFMDVLEGDEVIVKVNHFKPLFVGTRPDDRGLTNNAPTWIYQLLVEYCKKYPTIFTKDFREPIDVKDEAETRAMLVSLKEIYDLFRTLHSYFTADWQVAMSIGLSRHMGEGIWITQFADFARFMDQRMVCSITGDRGERETPEVLSNFLRRKGAQSSLQFTEADALPITPLSRNFYFVFHGYNISYATVGLQTMEKIKSFSKKGGTRRKHRRSVKTRHQKRR